MNNYPIKLILKLSSVLKCIFSDSIYTYELDSTLYYMFFAKDGDDFYYSKVYATNIKDLAAEREVSTKPIYKPKEKLTYGAMVKLSDSITDYRAWYYETHK